MSETLTLPDQTETTAEQQFPKLDGVLMPLVVANAEVIVRCPWMGDAEVSLTVAMLNYPDLMTEQNADQIIYEVHRMLANRVIEEEAIEEAEDQMAEDDNSAKEEDKKPEQQSPKIEQAISKPKIASEAKDIKNEQPAERSETEEAANRPAVQPNVENIAAAEQAAEDQGAKTPSMLEAAEMPDKTLAADMAIEAKNAKDSSKHPAAGEDRIDSVRSPEVLITRESPVVLQAKKSLENDEPEHSEKSERQIDSTEIVETDESLESLSMELPEQIEEITEETIDLHDETEADSEEFDAEPVGLEAEELVELMDGEELSPVSFDDVDELSVEPLAVFENEEQLTPVTQFDERIGDGESQTFEVTESQPEAVEETLLLIIKRLEDSEPERAEAASITLDKISELTAKLGKESREEIMDEAEAQKELEELYTELFEQLGIEYTPELIESLVHLAIQRHHSEHSKVASEVINENEPQDTGTHEVIKQLLASTRNFNKIMANAAALGKSAIRLYVYDFPTELRRRLAA